MKKLLSFLLVFSACQLFAQPNIQKLDSLLDLIDKNDQGMFSVAVSQNGQPIYQRAIGISSEGIKATTSTVYGVGSISKSFTATMIMQLVDEKKLELSTTIDKFFPKLPNAAQITVKQLLNHTSGVHDYTKDKIFCKLMTESISREKMMKVFEKSKPDFKPGEKFAYCNTNYCLLSIIIEKLDARTYDESLANRISGPLGLKHTFLGRDTKEQQYAASYFYQQTWVKAPVTDKSVALGAGAIVSTPDELNTFYTALFNGKLTSAESLTQMTALGKGRYGLGITAFPYYNRQALGHNGRIDGFQSISGYFKDSGFAFSIIHNGVRYNDNEISIGVLSAVFNDGKFQLPDFTEKPAVSVSEEELKKLTGKFATPVTPLKFTIMVEKGTLYAQASGQSAFPLKPVGDRKYVFEEAGIDIVFSEDNSNFVITQGGQPVTFSRE